MTVCEMHVEGDVLVIDHTCGKEPWVAIVPVPVMMRLLEKKA